MSDDAPPPQNIHQAIHAVKSALALHGIGKDRRNADQKYSFRGVEDVINALSELFVQHRINVVPRIIHTQSIARVTSKGSPMPASFVDAEFDLVSVDDGTFVTFKACGEGSDLSDKGTNKAMSAAFKYAMTLGFVIPTTGVLDEGDASTPGHEEPQRQQSRGDQGGGGRGREQQRDSRDDMKAWTERTLSKIATFTEPAHFEDMEAYVNGEKFVGLFGKLKQAQPDMWEAINAAIKDAYQRTDDVPF